MSRASSSTSRKALSVNCESTLQEHAAFLHQKSESTKSVSHLLVAMVIAAKAYPNVVGVKARDESEKDFTFETGFSDEAIAYIEKATDIKIDGQHYYAYLSQKIAR